MSDIKEKLIEDILKTGFPSELKAREIIESEDWHIYGSTYFIDQDEEKGREIDIQCHTSIQSDNKDEPHISVWTMLSIEVKKSTKPWVIFSSKRGKWEVGIPSGFGLPHYSHNISNKILSYQDIMQKFPSFLETENIGRTAYVAFTKEENPKIFSSILSSIKANIDWHKTTENVGEDYSKTSIDLVFFMPVIVLEGKLFEANLIESEMKVEEVSSFPLAFHYASPNYKPEPHLIDIVTMEALPEYLQSQKDWISNIFKTIKKNVNQ